MKVWTRLHPQVGCTYVLACRASQREEGEVEVIHLLRATVCICEKGILQCEGLSVLYGD